MTQPTITMMQVPMPIAGTPNAPYFDKKNVRHFLQIIERHGANAGITDQDEFIPYVLEYCSDEVRNTIRYLPEFDEDESGKIWKAAKDTLIDFYGSADDVPSETEEDLKNYCREYSRKPAFNSLQEVDDYRQGFTQLSAHLVKRGLLSDNERNSYLVHGIPTVMIDWFIAQLPEANRTRTKAPTVSDSFKILQKCLKPDSFFRNMWNEEPTTLQSQFTTKSNQVSAKPSKTLTTPVPPPPSQPLTEFPQISDRFIEELSRQFTEMTLNQISVHMAQAHSTHQSPVTTNTEIQVQDRSSDFQVATATPISLAYNDQDALQGDVFAVSDLSVTGHYSYTSTSASCSLPQPWSTKGKSSYDIFQQESSFRIVPTTPTSSFNLRGTQFDDDDSPVHVKYPPSPSFDLTEQEQEQYGDFNYEDYQYDYNDSPVHLTSPPSPSFYPQEQEEAEYEYEYEYEYKADQDNYQYDYEDEVLTPVEGFGEEVTIEYQADTTSEPESVPEVDFSEVRSFFCGNLDSYTAENTNQSPKETASEFESN